MNAPLDQTAATHLLIRAGFSATAKDVAAVTGQRREVAVDGLVQSMRTEAHTPPPEPATSMFSFAAPSDKDKDAIVADLAKEAGIDLDDMKKVGREVIARLAQRGAGLKAWWMQEMIETPSPLTERVVLAFANQFTSSLKKVKDPRLLYRQNVLYRKHAGGNYAELLHALVDDPAMLLYLDANNSKKEAPNENLGRELLELFTLGEGHYTEGDVKAAARALTGRRVRRIDGVVVEKRRERDADEKVFLGKRGDLKPHDLIDVLVAHPRSAELLVENLWRELIDGAPDKARVQMLARAFERDGRRMKPLLRALFLEEAFWRQPGGLVRSPVDLAVHCARTRGAQLAPQHEDARPESLVRACKKMGQDLFDPPNVKGWPRGEGWVTTTWIVERDRFLRNFGRALEDSGHKGARAELLDPRVQTK